MPVLPVLPCSYGKYRFVFTNKQIEFPLGYLPFLINIIVPTFIKSGMKFKVMCPIKQNTLLQNLVQLQSCVQEILLVSMTDEY